MNHGIPRLAMRLTAAAGTFAYFEYPARMVDGTIMAFHRPAPGQTMTRFQVTLGTDLFMMVHRALFPVYHLDITRNLAAPVRRTEFTFTGLTAVLGLRSCPPLFAGQLAHGRFNNSLTSLCAVYVAPVSPGAQRGGCPQHYEVKMQPEYFTEAWYK